MRSASEAPDWRADGACQVQRDRHEGGRLRTEGASRRSTSAIRTRSLGTGAGRSAPQVEGWPNIALIRQACVRASITVCGLARIASLLTISGEPKWEPTCTVTEPRQATSSQRRPR
jgi:hypothetical protein